MKRFTKTMLLVMIAAVSVLMVAQIAKAGIATTKHNLASSSSNTIKSNNTDDICVFCHTPHAGSSAAPLWNRANPTGTFTMYTSPSGTLDMTINAAPLTVSLACLSCHDGATAINNVTNAPGSGLSGTAITMANGVTVMPAGVTNLGTDLSNDHPISITYNTTLDTAFVAIANGKVGGLPLYGSKVECASCHDVHGGAAQPFLRVSNAASALCLKCHIK